MQVFELRQMDKLDYISRDEHDEKILLAMVRPILFALLCHLKREVIKDYEGIENIKLRQLARNQRSGCGDCGISFEYSVHSAIRNNNPWVMERIQHALNICGVKGNQTTSILLGFEKSGVLQITNNWINYVNSESILITGLHGEPIRIQDYIHDITRGFHNSGIKNALPPFIGGIWRADLFVGNTDSNMWVAASVKINPSVLRSDKGLCLGIVPAKGSKDTPFYTRDGMLVCPLPYDNSFMQYFYSAWRIVREFISNDAKMPKRMNLYQPAERRVAKYLESSREECVVNLIDDDLRELVHPTLVDLVEPKIEILDVLGNPINHDSSITIVAPDSIYYPKKDYC